MSKKIFRFFNKQKEFEQDVPENGMRVIVRCRVSLFDEKECSENIKIRV